MPSADVSLRAIASQTARRVANSIKVERVLAAQKAHHVADARVAAQTRTKIPVTRTATADLAAGAEAGPGQGLVQVVMDLNALYAVILISRI